MSVYFINSIFSKHVSFGIRLSESPLGNIIFLLISYLIGSFMLSILISKYYYKKDIREIGSKNPGFTNFARSFGKTTSLFVMISDILKGTISIAIAIILQKYTLFFSNSYIYIAAAGVILGHCFPIYFNFRGGKGVSTFLGVMIILNWVLGIIFIFLWLIFNVVFRYTSISSVITVLIIVLLSFIPVFRNISFDSKYWLLNSICLLILFIIILLKHQKNIYRIYGRKEPYSYLYLLFEKIF